MRGLSLAASRTLGSSKDSNILSQYWLVKYFPEKMSQESGNETFLAPSPSDVDVQDPNKRSKISYTREFLLSIDRADSTVKLSIEAQAVICACFFNSVVDEAPGLLSSPLCVPDSRCQRSVPQNFYVKVPNDVGHQLLHRSDEPYRPPCRYKALPSPTRDSNNLLDGDTSGSSECINQETADREIRRKDTVGVAKEDKWLSSKNADSKDSRDEFLMSPATRNSNTLQFTSSVISKQLDASQKSSQIQGAVRGDAGLPPTLLETAKNCPNPRQQVQDLTTNGTVNPWLKTVNHIDTSWNLSSMMDNGVQLMESEESSNMDVEHLEGNAHVMESLKKSRSPGFLSEENYEHHKKNHCEVAYEQGFMELQLSNTSVRVYDSPGSISISDPSKVYISPTSAEEEKQFVSMIDDCESTTVYCKGISVSTKQNPPCPDFQIHPELELNSFSGSFDDSNSSSELCLPDEDSLITFDELFLMPDVENLAVVDSSMSSSPGRNPIEANVFSPSSPREMVEKLVEFILNDESCTPHVDDPIVHHGAGVGGFSHSIHAQQTHTQFWSNQLNLEMDQQDYSSFQRNSIDSAIYSFFPHSFPPNTFSQPFPLHHDELRRFDHEASQSTFQQMINPGKLNLCSLSVSQSGVPSHLPALQMASCTQKLNSMQGCPFAYQEPKNCGDFIRPSPDFQGDSNINPAVVDSFIEMKLRASHWHPNVRGF
ncbi:hypothetical protein E2542_SST22852 [Spatholobus suberectus]|nr:hypothetical protein E2542_SST22852 [Spatholobus suberectus]